MKHRKENRQASEKYVILNVCTITVKMQKVSRFRFCSLLRFTVVCCIFPY